MTAAGLGDAGALADAVLDAIATPAHPGRRNPATSDLSIDETVALRYVGYEPVSLVMGSSIYHVGYVFRPGMGQAGELKDLSRAMSDARLAAMHRLEADCRRAGAHGVVGVRLEASRFAGHLMEFTAIGTAVVGTRERPGVGRGRDFFTSDLSGQELYLLAEAGWHPVGMVVGTCVWQIAFNWVPATADPQELTAPTTALYDARERAMDRLQREAAALGAHGVVGMRLTESGHAWGARAIEALAIGTAVIQTEPAHRPLGVRAVVAMEERLPSPTASGEGPGGEGGR